MLTFKQAPLSPSFLRSTLRSLVVGSALALCASAAQSAVISSIDAGNTHDFSPVNAYSANQISENGMTFTSTTGGSVYGYTGSYGLAANGSWYGESLIGLNSAGGFMTLTFDDPIAAVTAFVNYAPGYGTPYVSVFDSANQLIESLNLSFSTPYAYNAGQTVGFFETSDIIKSIRFGNAYIVASSIVTAAAVVPVPDTVYLMILGLGILIFALRRRAGSDRLSFAAA